MAGKSKAPRKATKEQASAVRRLVREQVASVEHIERAALRPLSEVLIHARNELRADLKKWMATVKDPTDRFGAHQMRVMLRTLEPTMKTLGIRMSDMLEAGKHPSATAMDRAMLKGLMSGDKAVGPLAMKNLEHEINRLGHVFGGELTGPNLDVTAALARGNKLLYRQYTTSAHRYAGKVGEDIRFQLAVGVAKNETFEQLTQRLRRLAGPTGPVALKGVLGHPSSVVEDIPEGLFSRYDSWARRVARTEMMNAYNDRHRDGIAELNATRGKHEPEWLRKSDAAGDARVCSICRWLDGKTCKIGESFPGGYGAPPYHPCCVLPGERVAGHALASTRIRYDGEAIELHTATGKVLRVTVNHPIPTTRGLVSAGDVREGDQVIADRRDIWPRAATSQIDEHDAPPSIEDVFDAFAQRVPMARTVTTDDDFHGDAARSDGNVDIVFADGLLLHDHDATCLESGRDLSLEPTDAGGAGLSRSRHPDPVVDCMDRTPRRIVCSSNLLHSLFDGHSAPLRGLCLGLPAHDHADRLEPRLQGAAGNAGFVAQALERFAGDVALDEVVQIRRFDYSGHVFDLQTDSGWMMVSGICISNCRCVELAWLADWPDDLGEIHDVKASTERSSPTVHYHVDATPPSPPPKPARRDPKPEKPTPPPRPHAKPTPHEEEAPIPYERPKNPKRVEAARKAGEVSAERRREIHSAVKSNLSPDLHVAWDKEGNKFLQQEAGRIKGVKDRINAASKISEAFTETYGSGEATAFGNEGDRYFKRAELEAAHAESWADEQEKKYYEEMQRHALADGDIDEHGELTAHGRSKLVHDVEYTTAAPSKTSDDDPPF